MVLELARPSGAWCFAPGGDFFEAVLLLDFRSCFTARSRRQQNLSKNAVIF